MVSFLIVCSILFVIMFDVFILLGIVNVFYKDVIVLFYFKFDEVIEYGSDFL